LTRNGRLEKQTLALAQGNASETSKIADPFTPKPLNKE
jgi:hypothetical protein